LKTEVILRMTGNQQLILRDHLFPGDGNEAVALALCGRRIGDSRQPLMIYKIVPITHSECFERRPGFLHWPTERVIPLVEEARKQKMAILKIHSHPGWYRNFSLLDDKSDRDLFSSIHGWVDDNQPHASAIMLPDGSIFGRAIFSDGELVPLSSVSVAGDSLDFWQRGEGSSATCEPGLKRNAQTFGEKTFQILRGLSIAVVGCSGTGSLVAEQLARLGVGGITLVDPDRAGVENLNRIPNSFLHHAKNGTFKVELLRAAIEEMGLGTKVSTFASSLFNPGVVAAVAQSDIVFGCMDTVDGRNLLNNIAVFYSIPYFDLGVRLDADGEGGVSLVCGTVHYLQPDGSSLLSRGVYTPDDIRTASLKRTNPEEYDSEIKSNYIRGIPGDRPAVISVNMQIASLAVNEMLARLHPFRNVSNAQYAVHGMNLTEATLFSDVDGPKCRALSSFAGRGDICPMLRMPELGTTESLTHMR